VIRVGNVLSDVLAKQPGRQRLTELRVAGAFREMLGEPLASSCEVVRVRASTLVLVTSNPALAHQLRLDSEIVLTRLNDKHLGVTLKTLQVRTGRSGFLGDGL
jgi:hypothetical protein